MTQREDELMDKGYDFTGIYTNDKEEAKARAKELRDSGKFASVVTIEPSKYSRGGGLTGYAVYSKEKEREVKL